MAHARTVQSQGNIANRICGFPQSQACEGALPSTTRTLLLPDTVVLHAIFMQVDENRGSPYRARAPDDDSKSVSIIFPSLAIPRLSFNLRSLPLLKLYVPFQSWSRGSLGAGPYSCLGMHIYSDLVLSRCSRSVSALSGYPWVWVDSLGQGRWSNYRGGRQR